MQEVLQKYKFITETFSKTQVLEFLPKIIQILGQETKIQSIIKFIHHKSTLHNVLVMKTCQQNDGTAP